MKKGRYQWEVHLPHVVIFAYLLVSPTRLSLSTEMQSFSGREGTHIQGGHAGLGWQGGASTCL